MNKEKRYVIKKDEKTNVITYMEYEKREGLRVKPKNKISFDDMINVNEMIVINPSLIKKLINKKTSKNFSKILKMLSVVEDDTDDGSGYMLILDEITRLRNLIINKYKKYLAEKEYEVLLKKLEILKQEVEIRQKNILEDIYNYSESKKNKSSR